MSGVKGRSGRKKTISTLVNEAIDNVRQDLPRLFEALKKKALEGDREATMYLIDRVLGKPKQQTDIDLTGGKQIGAGLVVELMQILTEKKKELEESKIVPIEGDFKELDSK